MFLSLGKCGMCRHDVKSSCLKDGNTENISFRNSSLLFPQNNFWKKQIFKERNKISIEKKKRENVGAETKVHFYNNSFNQWRSAKCTDKFFSVLEKI